MFRRIPPISERPIPLREQLQSSTSPPSGEPRLFSVADCARLYGVGKTTVRRLTNDGMLESVKIYARRLIVKASAEALFDPRTGLYRNIGRRAQNSANAPPRDFEKFWQNNEWFLRRLVQSNHAKLIQDKIYPDDDPAITSDDVLAGVKAFVLSPEVTTGDPVWTLYRGKEETGRTYRQWFLSLIYCYLESCSRPPINPFSELKLD